MAIGQSDKTRQERLLQNTKGYKPLIGRGEPRQDEGANGDMRINMTNFGFFSNNSVDSAFIVPNNCSVFGVYKYVILFNLNLY